MNLNSKTECIELIIAHRGSRRNAGKDENLAAADGSTRARDV